MRLTLLIIFISIILIPGSSYCQQFNTGVVGVTLADTGRMKFYAPSYDSTEHINRISILVGQNSYAVFDFEKDVGVIQPAVNVTLPPLSDFEIRSVINNSYSNLPPDVEIRTSIYGWLAKGFVLVKYSVINDEPLPLDAILGIEILPRIGGDYGDEIVEYIYNEGVISIHKSIEYVGYKWLSSPLESLRSIEWYDGYNDTDSTLWNNLIYQYLDPIYIANNNGSVVFPAQFSEIIEPDDSTTTWFAMAYGITQTQMLANIEEAELMYNSLGVSDTPISMPVKFYLSQNYPNPFNSETIIVFTLPTAEGIELNIFDSRGNEVFNVYNSLYSAGEHKIRIMANDLSSGIYFYRLKTTGFSITRKMVLIK